MKKSRLLIFIVPLLFIINQAAISQEKQTINGGAYLNQKPPGKTPEIFAPGIVSTDEHEFACTFSPSGDKFYFTRAVGQNRIKAIMVSTKTGSTWSQPEKALKIFENENFEPHITPDGKKLYFMGFNPKESQPRPDLDMFCAAITPDGIGEIKCMEAPFNPANSMFISSTSDGTIYTTDAKKMDIARARLVNGQYQSFENLGAPINSENVEFYPFISPDESYIIFCGERPEGRGMFASFTNKDCGWTEPKAVPIGMDGGCPSVSPDGKYLFFVAGRPGDIYWVSMDIVNDLRPEGMK